MSKPSNLPKELEAKARLQCGEEISYVANTLGISTTLVEEWKDAIKKTDDIVGSTIENHITYCNLLFPLDVKEENLETNTLIVNKRLNALMLLIVNILPRGLDNAVLAKGIELTLTNITNIQTMLANPSDSKNEITELEKLLRD